MQNSSKKVVVRNKRRINVKVVHPPKMEKAAPKDSAEKVPFKLSESEKKIIQAYRMAGRNDKAAVQNTLVHYFLPPVTKLSDEKPAQLDNFEDIESEPELSNSRGTLRKIFTGIGICFIALFATFLFYELFFVPTNEESSSPVKISSSDMSSQPSQQNVNVSNNSEASRSKYFKYNSSKVEDNSKLVSLDELCDSLNKKYNDSENKKFHANFSNDGKEIYATIWVDGTYESVITFLKFWPDNIDTFSLWKVAKEKLVSISQECMNSLDNSGIQNINVCLDLLNDKNRNEVILTVENSIVTYDYFTDNGTAELSTILASQEVVPTPEPENNSTPSNVSREYLNALEKARFYSNEMSMSKQGLYDQLTSEYGENFPVEAAQYAIDNLDADYYANALNKAKFYYENMNMSKESIREQLVSEYGEGFTQEEADYAIDNLD